MKTFFISSTFKDMQAERDILHERIFPRLRHVIKQYGDDVQEVDLRWGVDTVNMTEEESGHEVLKICIDAIDRCKPYLVVLLGERYGWIPGKTIVDQARDQRISDRYEDEMSITELEIRYGALLGEDTFERCIFCFRDPAVLQRIDDDSKPIYQPESPRHADRLAVLKSHIRQRKDAIILEYTADWDRARHVLCGLEDFETRLYNRLESMIRRDFADRQTKDRMERQVEETELIKTGYLSSYVRRYPEELQISRELYNFQQQIAMGNPRMTDCLLVCGDAGSGKSALMAYMGSSVPKMQGSTILCFAAASGCRDVPQLKRYIAYRMETLLDEPHTQNPASVDELLRTLNKKAAGKGFVCFVDGLDQIYHGQQDPYLDLPALCPDLLWVFSALPDFPFDRAAADYTCRKIHVDRLYPSQRTELIAATASKRGKKLDRELVELIASGQGAGNPLFLSLVLQRLFMMNKEEFEQAEALAPGMEGLHRYMQQLLTAIPDTPEQMATYILHATAGLFGQEPFSEVLMLIACARNGLTEKELEELLALEQQRFSAIRFQQTVSYLYDAFTQLSSGKWTFHHRLFGEAVTASMTEADRTRIYGLLASYSLQNEEFLRREGFFYLFSQRHPDFYRVLESAKSWDSSPQIYELVGSTAAKDASVRTFLTELTAAHPTDDMAEFWLEFQSTQYGSDVEAMTDTIRKRLLDAPDLSHDKTWKLCLLLSRSEAQKNHWLDLLQQAQTVAATLPEPDLTIARAAIEADLTETLTALGKPHGQVLDARKRSRQYVDQAFALLGQGGEWPGFRRLFDSLLTLCLDASQWEDPDAPELWLHALELLEQTDRFAAAQEDDYTYYQVQFLHRLCSLHSRRPFRDNEKARTYGDRALPLAETAASQRPTIRNLENRYHALNAYTLRLKDTYTHPYWRQAVDCARRIYASRKLERYHRLVAVSEAEYAISYLNAVLSNTVDRNQTMINDANRLFDHSCQIFEEMTADKEPRLQFCAYYAFLATRTEISVRLGNLEQAKTCGQKSMDCLTQWRNKMQKRMDEATDPDALRDYQWHRDWATGWLGRVQSQMSLIYLAQLDAEKALSLAKEGLVLNLDSTRRYKAYYEQVLNCGLTIAQSLWYLRRDAEALTACDRVDELLADQLAEKYNRSALEAETLYIRSRIALAQGDPDAAWHHYRACQEREKTGYLPGKLLILYAELLTAAKDPQAEQAWKEAWEHWRKLFAPEKKTFERFVLYNFIDPTAPDAVIGGQPWSYHTAFVLPAYYYAYCSRYHITTNAQRAACFDPLEQKILYAISLLDKGDLQGILPFGMQEKDRSFTAASVPADCPDFAGFVSAIGSLADFRKSTVDTAIFPTILRYIDRFPGAEPDPDQFNSCHTIARILYDRLVKESRDAGAIQMEQALLQNILPLRKKLPACTVRLDFNSNICEIWPESYLAGTGERWYALMKLYLLLLRRNSVLNRTNRSKLRTVYRAASRELGGSEKIEEADLSRFTNQDLQALLAHCDTDEELRSRISNIYWYALKNVWSAELYRRTGNPAWLKDRLQTLERFTAEEYVQIYNETDSSKKTDMPTEVRTAILHLIEVLQHKGCGNVAAKILRWLESLPGLGGQLRYKTLYSVEPADDADRLWLEETKLQYCKKWMEAEGGNLWSLRSV